VLKKIFGTKRKEEVGKWRNMHTEELRNLYSSPNFISHQIKVNEMGWTCSIHEIWNWYKTLFGIPERKRPLWRPRLIWEHDIKMDLTEMVCDDVDWIPPAKNRIQRLSVLNIRVP